jgi:Xaa-Pro aminopeptidase
VSGERVERVRAAAVAEGAESLLVTDPVNVLYLTGLASSNAACIVRPDGIVLLTDGRYFEAARRLPDVDPIQAGRDLYGWLGSRLGDLAPGPVAYEADHVTVARAAQLRESGAELVETVGLMKRIRAVKSPEELDGVRAAAQVNDAMYERLAGERIVGRTELELSWWIVGTLADGGADAIAFDPIVAAGPNAAVPHHHPTGRQVGAGETVIVDAGATVGGYRSDCTRTFATGPLPEELSSAYELCARAQARSLEAVRAGAAGRDVDAVARSEIGDSGLAPVLHGLGHGVGLDIHELPLLSDVSDSVLEPGNVVTVEPGVYLPGLGGVRIEDLVIVTDDGPEVLTPFTKELVTLG